jgi:tripartite-type tricarboxylate transporter receptor subunit TctC
MHQQAELRSVLRLAALSVLTAVTVGCRDRDAYPSRPITLVCPWAAGGGTDRVSRQIAAHLEHELAQPVNVINATGGKGVTGHSRGLGARPDGYTLTMITLELNMMHWSGLTDLTYEDCIPLMSVNEDYAALFVRAGAPWQSLPELKRAIQESPGELQASGTATGGAWHLALAGWLIADGMEADDVNWISSEGAGPSLQQLMGGGFHMVCCSLPEADSLLRAGEVRALGVMAPKRADGYADVPTFREQGSDWALGGWRGLAVPLGTPPDVAETLEAAIEKVVTGQTRIASQEDADGTTFPEFMQAQKFDHTYRRADEFRTFLAETDRKLGELLTSEAMASVNRDRFHPMAFPAAIMGLMVVVGAAIAVQTLAAGKSSSPPPVQETPSSGPTTGRGRINFILFAAAVVVYLLFAEVIGFLVLGGGLLLAMLLRLNVRLFVAAPIAVLLVVVINQLFAHLLRVPLPRGILGW